MNDSEFDRALVAAAFRLIAERGWSKVSVVEAARRAGLPLDRARARFPVRVMLLLRFGRLADQAALAVTPPEGSHRDQLFDVLMRRIDALQAHREGVQALLRGLPADPCAAAMLTAANLRSMGWMLEAADIRATGLYGALRCKGLLAVWLSAIRVWNDDTSEDLSATMAELDKSLRRAERVDGWLRGRRNSPAATPTPSTATPPADPASMDPPFDDLPPMPPEPLPESP